MSCAFQNSCASNRPVLIKGWQYRKILTSGWPVIRAASIPELMRDTYLETRPAECQLRK
jgi:hypothetical protein